MSLYMTNYEALMRNISPRKLAKFLAEDPCTTCCICHGKDCPEMSCEKAILAWLMSDVGGEHR